MAAIFLLDFDLKMLFEKDSTMRIYAAVCHAKSASLLFAPNPTSHRGVFATYGERHIHEAPVAPFLLSKVGEFLCGAEDCSR
jgi:uncharacterized protein (UPF0332 family)